MSSYSQWDSVLEERRAIARLRLGSREVDGLREGMYLPSLCPYKLRAKPRAPDDGFSAAWVSLPPPSKNSPLLIASAPWASTAAQALWEVKALAKVEAAAALCLCR